MSTAVVVYDWRNPDKPRLCYDAAENRHGHKPLSAYRLPKWVQHPLKKPVKPIALVFPGEHSHSEGSFQTSIQSIPKITDMVELASEVFGFDVAKLANSGPALKIARTSFNQPITYVANCCALEKMRLQSPEKVEQCQAVAGFSVGEVSALVAAEVIPYEIGLEIVKVRAEAMQRLADKIEMQALVLNGFGEEKVLKLIEQAEKADAAAGETAPCVRIARHWGGSKGFVCAGKRSTVHKLLELGKAGRPDEARLLDDAIQAAHTELMQEAADEVEACLRRLLPHMRPPRCELYLNHTGCRVHAGRHPASFIDALCKQLTTPLLWHETVVNFCQDWVHEIWEVGTGRTLSLMCEWANYHHVRCGQVFRPADVMHAISA